MKNLINVFKALVTERGLMDHHIKPYDELILENLQNVIYRHGKIITVFEGCKYFAKMVNYKFVKSSMSPSEAHLFKESYCGTIYVDIITSVSKEDVCLSSSVTKNYLLCKFPIMLNSVVCHISEGNDADSQQEREYGGSFIINGNRRYIPIRESMEHNHVFRTITKKPKSYSVELRSEHKDHQYRSTSTMSMSLPMTIQKRSLKCLQPQIKISFLKYAIPIRVLLMAMDVDIDYFISLTLDCWKFKWCNNELKDYLVVLKQETFECKTEEDARQYIFNLYKACNKSPTNNTVSIALKNEILPHLNFTDDVKYQKTWRLAHMYGMLILFSEGKLKKSNIDSLKSTHLVSSAELLGQLFRTEMIDFIKQGVKTLRKNLQRNVNENGSTRIKFPDISKIFNSKLLSPKILSAVATGRWTDKKNGVSHPISAVNPDSTITRLMRILSPLVKKRGKHNEARKIQTDSFGYFGAFASSDKEDCGLVKTFALLCRMSIKTNSDTVTEVMTTHLKDHIFPKNDAIGSRYIFFNGDGIMLGFVSDIDVFEEKVILMKENLLINPEITYWRNNDLQEFRIYCNSGRMIRPLLVLKNKHKICETPTYNNLISNGCIRYVSACEEHNLNISFQPEGADLLEISRFSYLGLIAASAPYINCNQGPRTVYWTIMCNNSIWGGINNDKSSTTQYRLYYGSKPLVQSQVAKIMGMGDQLKGENCVVALIAKPCNIEDGVIVNKSSIERGLLTAEIIKKIENIANCPNINPHEIFEVPDSETTFGLKMGNKSKIGKDGMPKLGLYFKPGDVIIGKTSIIKKVSDSSKAKIPKGHSKRSKKSRKDESIVLNSNQKGFIETVVMVKKKYSTSAAVYLRKKTNLHVGAKVTSTHAQKGVVSEIVPEVDLPYSIVTGKAPDIVMSPMGFPSRMTFGQMHEMPTGKAVALSCKSDIGIERCCPTEKTTMKTNMTRVKSELKKYGFASNGCEKYIDGKTGKMIDAEIFTGMAYYVRLTQMAEEKAHVRATGERRILERAPEVGRRKFGGLKFGEMEMCACVAHGASESIRERACTTSDKFVAYVCKQCGNIVYGNTDINMYHCTYCKTGEHIRTVILPYAIMLLTKEVGATGVKIRLEVEDTPIE